MTGQPYGSQSGDHGVHNGHKWRTSQYGVTVRGPLIKSKVFATLALAEQAIDRAAYKLKRPTYRKPGV